MHSPQFAHAHKTTRDHYTCWNSEHSRTFFSVLFIYSLFVTVSVTRSFTIVESLCCARCAILTLLTAVTKDQDAQTETKAKRLRSSINIYHHILSIYPIV